MTGRRIEPTILRTASTAVSLGQSDRRKAFRDGPMPPNKPYVPTPPVTAGGLVFVAGSDGKVRALDATDRPVAVALRHRRARSKLHPRSGKAASLLAVATAMSTRWRRLPGRLLWRFRAAPQRRLIMVYGNLCSTWPVNTGVLVHEGTAYFAAGIVDHDGTYVYALDAKIGEDCNGRITRADT